MATRPGGESDTTPQGQWVSLQVVPTWIMESDPWVPGIGRVSSSAHEGKHHLSLSSKVAQPQGHSHPRHKSSEMLPRLVWATPPPQQAGHGARTAQGPGHSLGLGKSVLCLPSWLLGPETRAFPACAQQWTPAGEPSCCPQDLQLYQRHLQPNRAASVIH